MRDQALLNIAIPGGYIAMSLIMTRHAYVQIIDNDRELDDDVTSTPRLNAVLFGVLWPLSLLAVAIWHLGNGWLFRETRKQRKALEEAEKHGRGVW